VLLGRKRKKGQRREEREAALWAAYRGRHRELVQRVTGIHRKGRHIGSDSLNMRAGAVV
jgi:hypothetical protein